MITDSGSSPHNDHFLVSGKSPSDDLTSAQENAQHEEERARALSDPSPSSQPSSDLVGEINSTEASFTRDLKNQQVELITSKINFLKDFHPDETVLISLLESYLQRYEQILDSRTFDQWRTDILKQKQQKVTLDQQGGSKDINLEIQDSDLNILITENQILNAILSEPVQLEKARAFHHIHSTHSLSKDAFENAEKALKLKSQYDSRMNEYTQVQAEYSQARKAYYNTLEEVQRGRLDAVATKSTISNLYTVGIGKKNILKECKAKLTSDYGPLEKVSQLQQQCLRASNAMTKSGSFFKKKAIVLEQIESKILEQPEINCYRNRASIFDLLAQDHFLLAKAIIKEKKDLIHHLNALISLAKHAESASEHQLSIFSHPSHKTEDQHFIEPSQKALSLLQEAGSCFLSAYHHLKNQNPSSSLQDLSDRGFSLINTALIFNLSLIAHEQSSESSPDFLATIENAQHHAELVIQETADETKRFYHAKVASFLYSKILASNYYLETCMLQQTIHPQSVSSYFLDQTALAFSQSINYFHQVSQLSLDQLNSTEGQSLIQTAIKSKEKASTLLFQTKNLLFPNPTAPTSQNEDLL